MFFKRQTFVNWDCGEKIAPSGTVKSWMNSMRSQPRFGVGVGDWNGVRVGVSVLVGVRDGVNVNVGVLAGVFVGVKVLVGVFVGVYVGVFDGV